MATNINSPSSPVLLANESHLQGVTPPVVGEGVRTIVSPQSNVDFGAALIHAASITIQDNICSINSREKQTVAVRKEPSNSSQISRKYYGSCW